MMKEAVFNPYRTSDPMKSVVDHLNAAYLKFSDSVKSKNDVALSSMQSFKDEITASYSYLKDLQLNNTKYIEDIVIKQKKSQEIENETLHTQLDKLSSKVDRLLNLFSSATNVVGGKE